MQSLTMFMYLGSKICKFCIVPGRATIPNGKIGKLLAFKMINYWVNKFLTVFVSHY